MAFIRVKYLLFLPFSIVLLLYMDVPQYWLSDLCSSYLCYHGHFLCLVSFQSVITISVKAWIRNSLYCCAEDKQNLSFLRSNLTLFPAQRDMKEVLFFCLPIVQSFYNVLGKFLGKSMCWTLKVDHSVLNTFSHKPHVLWTY